MSWFANLSTWLTRLWAESPPGRTRARTHAQQQFRQRHIDSKHASHRIRRELQNKHLAAHPCKAPLEALLAKLDAEREALTEQVARAPDAATVHTLIAQVRPLKERYEALKQQIQHYTPLVRLPDMIAGHITQAEELLAQHTNPPANARAELDAIIADFAPLMQRHDQIAQQPPAEDNAQRAELQELVQAMQLIEWHSNTLVRNLKPKPDPQELAAALAQAAPHRRHQTLQANKRRTKPGRRTTSTTPRRGNDYYDSDHSSSSSSGGSRSGWGGFGGGGGSWGSSDSDSGDSGGDSD